MLAALLDPDQAVRTEAVQYLFGTLNHQNTLYSATVPAAIHVAAILPDPRTTNAVDKDQYDFPGCLRAELLAWIASVADEVSDSVDAIRRQHGFSHDDYPPAVGIRGIRPLLFSAAFDYVSEPDRHVREAAIRACIPLVDDPRVTQRRQTLVPLVRDILGTSELWQHREQAIDALTRWGEDSSGIEGQRSPFLFCDTDLSAGSSSWPALSSLAEGCEEPPF
ncbi:hypothetical protein AB0M31_35745 [Streptomyces sp. NPDC051773]|uniref:hypothetical protein n=1 Tax=Streptomyces sp. NPDC051773 TaxID=3156682 RepID=UPI00341DC87B